MISVFVSTKIITTNDTTKFIFTLKDKKGLNPKIKPYSENKNQETKKTI